MSSIADLNAVYSAACDSVSLGLVAARATSPLMPQGMRVAWVHGFIQCLEHSDAIRASAANVSEETSLVPVSSFMCNTVRVFSSMQPKNVDLHALSDYAYIDGLSPSYWMARSEQFCGYRWWEDVQISDASFPIFHLPQDLVYPIYDPTPSAYTLPPPELMLAGPINADAWRGLFAESSESLQYEGHRATSNQPDQPAVGRTPPDVDMGHQSHASARRQRPAMMSSGGQLPQPLRVVPAPRGVSARTPDNTPVDRSLVREGLRPLAALRRPAPPPVFGIPKRPMRKAAGRSRVD